jgi:hypothetical protein
VSGDLWWISAIGFPQRSDQRRADVRQLRRQVGVEGVFDVTCHAGASSDRDSSQIGQQVGVETEVESGLSPGQRLVSLIVNYFLDSKYETCAYVSMGDVVGTNPHFERTKKMKTARSQKHPIIFKIQMNRMRDKGATIEDVTSAAGALYKKTVAELKAILKEG